jgi:TRAP-type C4-dicarboxylate transport system substrate-binding protein
VADIGFDQPSYSKGRFPTIEIMEQPWGYPNVIVAQKTTIDVFNKFKPQELSGVHTWIVTSFGHPVLATNKAVRTLSDLKPLKIRGTGNMATMIEGLGAAAVSMPIFEVYDALNKGTIDGTLVGPETLSMYKFTEVAKYCTDVSFIAPNMVSMSYINLDTWNSLPPDIQKVFNDITVKYDDIMGQEIENYSVSAFDYAREHNMEVITINPAEQVQWQTAMKALTTKFVADKQGTLSNAQEVATYIQDCIKKYSP